MGAEMSTYAVFGMTMDHAKAMAKKQVEREINKQNKYIPLDERSSRYVDRATEIFESNQVVRLSNMFDAPDFAVSFKELAAKSQSRDLHVKGHFKTEEKSKKTGRPKLVWETVGV